MFKGTITFAATGRTEDEVIEKILFDLHEEIRREGEGIKVEECEEEND